MIRNRKDPPLAGPTEPLRNFTCEARSCPMPGTIFPGSGTRGLCQYHYPVAPQDWPRITQQLLDWDCVTHEIVLCRRACSHSLTSLNPAALDAQLAAAWARLQVQAPSYVAELAPQLDKAGKPSGYAAWGRRLEAFMTRQLAPKRIAA